MPVLPMKTSLWVTNRFLVTKMGDTFLYFAFGSNLWSERIRFANPSAVAKGPAKLEGYRLEFRLPSKVKIQIFGTTVKT